MSAKTIDHMGFVVKDTKKTVELFEKLFGVKGTWRKHEIEKVILGQVTVNGIRFVFNEPYTDDTRWAAFLRERGEGLEHICFSNFDFDEMVDKAKSLGLKLKEEPHKLVNGRRANFISQEQLHAAQIEFMEPSEEEDVQ